jgi:hypothetical protein
MPVIVKSIYLLHNGGMIMSRVRYLILAMAAAMAALLSTAAAAQASPSHTPASPRTTVRDSGGMPAGTRITLPSGRMVTLPKAWSQMTISDLAKIGIHPGMGKADTGTAGVSRVRPDSATKCDELVCTEVIGSGLTMTHWDTWAYWGQSSRLCTYPTYWLPPSQIFFTGKEQCDNGPLYFYNFYNNTIILGSSSNVCNTWVSLAGKPCVYVHS